MTIRNKQFVQSVADIVFCWFLSLLVRELQGYHSEHCSEFKNVMCIKVCALF